ncbi:hypothetical protein AQPW35_05890 [Rubrivivax pictus]|uniref:Uncharacterized protein n=2 Tax=Pseudaquabacterium pictum TaxID=2315236 RepID=A0A480ARY2_9BURK|nr:hypothetical protein AQPW35_05890 [Rubrivivax pictus]
MPTVTPSTLTPQPGTDRADSTAAPDALSDEAISHGERLSADDMATAREAQFTAAALAAARRPVHTAPAGVCGNCQARCLPTAKYCDEDCRADHERRLSTLRRQGRAPGGMR